MKALLVPQSALIRLVMSVVDSKRSQQTVASGGHCRLWHQAVTTDCGIRQSQQAVASGAHCRLWRHNRLWHHSRLWRHNRLWHQAVPTGCGITAGCGIRRVGLPMKPLSSLLVEFCSFMIKTVTLDSFVEYTELGTREGRDDSKQ